MYIRLYAVSDTVEECKEIFDDAIADIEDYIDKVEKLSIVPYWKFDDSHVLEIKMRLKVILTEERVKRFRDTISDEWLFFGYPKMPAEPYIEMLASRTSPGCNFLKDNIDMIVVEFDRNEMIIQDLD